MSLKKYNNKRNFKKTPEPRSRKNVKSNKLIFVVHRHAATRLHFDLRIEHNGVLKSWPIPKGPSMDPNDKRLAIQVEDHPLTYAKFEGEIPEGNYGAGEVEIWDSGFYYYPGMKNADKSEIESKIEKGLKKGHIRLYFEGRKLKGEFSLVKFRTEKNNTWLFIKYPDEYADSVDEVDVIKEVQPLKQISKPELLKLLNKFKLKSRPIIGTVKPMLASQNKKPFDDPEWIYEIKYDGYRALTELKDNKVELISRNGMSFNNQFSEIVSSLARVNYSAIFDGELVVLDSKGRSDFSAIKSFERSTKNVTLAYFIFDLLELEGHDLTKHTLLERKQILKEVLPSLPNVKYSDHVVGRGIEFFNLAKEQMLEGIIAKKKTSIYRPGKRSKEWIKIKAVKQIKAYIVGFTSTKSKKVGSLALATKLGHVYKYIGNVGTGLTTKELLEIKALIEPKKMAHHPFKRDPNPKNPTTWVKPKLQVKINYTEKTPEGYLRHPSFNGLVGITLGESKDTKHSDTQAKFHISNPDKVFWPKSGYTKADLIKYYLDISEILLPYLKDRPQSLNRHPNGITGESFYQKDMPEHTPKWIKTTIIRSDSAEKDINYLLCQDKATLVYMANLGAIEINPWHSRIGNLDKPDFLVIDLDPRGVTWKDVIKVAQVTHKLLEEIKVRSYCKTSGIKGIHIYIPLGAKYNYTQVLEFAKLLGALIHERLPKLTSLERNPEKRKHKVYLDLYQNRRGQTIVAPYSVRPFPGATVSAPIEWEEVNGRLRIDRFTIKNMIKRIEQKGDIWEGIMNKGVSIKKAVKEIESMMN